MKPSKETVRFVSTMQDRDFRAPQTGGLADGLRAAEFDTQNLARGLEVEFEHTGDRLLAMRIAMDHLVEDPDYYIKLAKIEKASKALKNKLLK